MARIAVYLNIYDMYWLNEYASNVGVGVYHSGVEIYGIEYAYGGHPLPFSGIFENTPRDANELGENFKFRESIVIGETDFSAADVKRMIQLMGEEYRGDRYHLISKNCNHFTAALSKTLTGNDIPPWVNRLATISGSIPFLERWIPAEWLTPIALQQSLDDKSKMKGTTTTIAPRRSQFTDPSTSTMNGTAVGGASTASWKWFQRQASSSSVVANSSDSAIRSAPNSARSSVNPAGNTHAVVSQASSQSLTKLWNSIKNIASSATDSCSPTFSSSTSLKKSFDQPQSSQPPSPSTTKTNKPPSGKSVTNRPSDC